MSDHPRASRFARLIARCYPRDVREQYAEDIARFIDDARRDPRYRDHPFGRPRIALRLAADALASLIASWRHGAPRPIRTSTQTESRSFSMDALFQDIRFALRGFVRRPGFTAIALITLALGIGANTAIFTLVNAVLLQPLPFPKPNELVSIWGASATQNRLLISVPDMEDLRARTRTLADIGMARSVSVNLTGTDRPDRIVGNFVNASTLKVLGAQTTKGRIFTPEETALGAGSQVVVISYPMWQARFGGAQDVIGKTIVLNGRPHEIIGVTVATFIDPWEAEAWIPITSAPSRTWFDRNNGTVWAVGRLKPGQTAVDAQKELAALIAQLGGEHPANGTVTAASVTDLREVIVGSSRFILIVLFGAVLSVLLIVCVNIANLQLVRASTRAREMSVRAALGANRGRLALQAITESLLLSVFGAAIGIVLGNWAVKILVPLMRLPNTSKVEIDMRVLAFSFGGAVLTGLLFGAPAALKGSRINLQDALRTRTEQASSRRFNTRNALVVVELSLCIVLLAVAGLFTRSLRSLQHIEAGFQADHILTAELRLPTVKYGDSLKVHQFMSQALEKLRAIPGVTSAALVDAVPLSGNFGSLPYVAQGQPEPTSNNAPTTQITTASDGYFKVMGIPLLAGRDFDEHDQIGTEPVAIINKTFAATAWPGESPLGKTVRIIGSTDVITLRVVGVVGAIKQLTLSEKEAPQLYYAKMQNSGIFTSVVMKTTGDPDAQANALRGAIWSVDRDQPVWKVRSMDFLLNRDLSGAKFSVTLVGAFAALALLLGVIGVYGVMSFSVAQRTRELGIRMALGARRGQVLGDVMRSGFEVVVVAIVIGVAGALVAGRYLQEQLYAVGGADALTMIVVPMVLGAVALLACWLPARRASRVDPVIALRNE